MHKTAPGACLLNAPGALCFLNIVLEHKVLMVQGHMVLDHKSRPKSQKSLTIRNMTQDHLMLNCVQVLKIFGEVKNSYFSISLA